MISNTYIIRFGIFCLCVLELDLQFYKTHRRYCLTMNKFNRFFSVLAIAALVVFIGCGDDDEPPLENEKETITDVILTFTSATEMVTAVASDQDGLVPGSVVIEDIELQPNTVYTLTIGLQNIEGLAEIKDIAEEVAERDDEHMFFFGWTGPIFQSPTGLGNIGAENRDNDMNYQDQDENRQPVGLTTVWETSEAGSVSGEFRVILKHQPGIKSASSTSEDGESDLDLTFNITVL